MHCSKIAVREQGTQYQINSCLSRSRADRLAFLGLLVSEQMPELWLQGESLPVRGTVEQLLDRLTAAGVGQRPVVFVCHRYNPCTGVAMFKIRKRDNSWLS